MKRAREEFKAAYSAYKNAEERAHAAKRALVAAMVDESLPPFKEELHKLDVDAEFTEIIDSIIRMQARNGVLLCVLPDCVFTNCDGIRLNQEIRLPIVTNKDKWIRTGAQRKLLPEIMKQYKDFVYWIYSKQVGEPIYNIVWSKSAFSDDLDDFFYEIKGV